MIRRILFDLDGTLYSSSLPMEDDIRRRMSRYVAEWLGMPEQEAREYRRTRLGGYGTTLEWLMAEEGFDEPEAYFAAVHPEGEEGCIPPDPALDRLLGSLGLPMSVLTNSPSEHARRVLSALGVEGRFEAIYDIRFNGLRGKPHPEAYLRACEAAGVRVEEVLFVDDLPPYVAGFAALGGRALLIDERGRHAACGLPSVGSLSELPGLLAAGPT